MPHFKPVIITTTTATREEAEKIGLLLLQKQLAACVQYEDITSQYVWQGEIYRDPETRLVIKTARCYYGEIEKTIRAHHSYECPQILMQTVSRGFVPYLRWMKAQLGL
ncbi:divalent-cation tolerance protein CutA [Neisseria perflava]|uniref:divalent-cation tolerance protein CutA n=1 Tax=Neisseria perflava TaxID=33053 RepID=UPI0020A1085E|nr:divalent cation tolerance protein CutA [Neisseria perflava]MCP1659653.1 periplasmic divalent cation tolerance protein [Neisseria perflava]MCP1771327.1 periplasmic divalent cation tolerance protein [Neisseria perflava]